MKTNLGLLIAVVLGLTGALLNWVYLSQKSREVEKVSFVGIAPSVTVQRGDTFRDEHFVAVSIPRSTVGLLDQFAVLYADRGTVVGMRATRNYEGGQLLLREDLKTPPAEIKLAYEKDKQECAMWVPVDTRSFVPSLITPGDWVSFLVAATPGSLAPPEEADPDAPPAAPLVASKSEIIGPFRVLSLGNRLGSAEVFKASGLPQQQENVMTISVTVRNGELDEKAKKLFALIGQSSLRQAGVILHPKTDKLN